MCEEEEIEHAEEMGYVISLPQFSSSILSPAWTTESFPVSDAALDTFRRAIPYVEHAVRHCTRVLQIVGQCHPLWVKNEDRIATGTTAAIAPGCYMGNDRGKVLQTPGAGNYVRVASGAMCPFEQTTVPPASVVVIDRPTGCELIVIRLTREYPLTIPVPSLFIPSTRTLVAGQKGVISGYPSPAPINNLVEAKKQYYSRVHSTQYANLAMACTAESDLIAQLDRSALPNFADFANVFTFGFHLHHSPAEILAVDSGAGTATFAGTTTKGYCGSFFRPLCEDPYPFTFSGVVTGPRYTTDKLENVMITVAHRHFVILYAKATAEYWQAAPQSTQRDLAVEYFHSVAHVIKDLRDKVPPATAVLAGLL
eukprot:TRINITY_DN27542_c0_g1_i1.p1 TRINITY_DN27542_c0_g1~~TRINITY_DN27542_c0_g1_i1.p1  ORF type:complete len:367 (-),score=35.95 TRINITY_DN27542_c0_g1_i1:132-1232(-)